MSSAGILGRDAAPAASMKRRVAGGVVAALSCAALAAASYRSRAFGAPSPAALVAVSEAATYAAGAAAAAADGSAPELASVSVDDKGVVYSEAALESMHRRCTAGSDSQLMVR